MAVINAANIDKDISWMRENAGSFCVEIKDLSGDLSLIALQGQGRGRSPAAGEVNLKDIGFKFAADVKCASKTLHDIEVRIHRRGRI